MYDLLYLLLGVLLGVVLLDVSFRELLTLVCAFVVTHAFVLLVKDTEIVEENQKKYKHLKQLKLISEFTFNYWLIKEYFDNSRAHTGVNVRLKSIHRYNNLESKKSFENNFSKDSRMLLWHGTKQRFLDSIFAEGLKLPNDSILAERLKLRKKRRMFGEGIYFADRVTKSVNYTDYKRGVGTLLLCEVAVGDM
jgi:hypothetical protein